MTPPPTNQPRHDRLLAVVTGTILDHEILRGEFHCFTMPLATSDAEFILDYVRDVEDHERQLCRSWAEINGEPEVIRPRGIEVRLAVGNERKLRTPRCWGALDTQSPVLTLNLEDRQVTPEQLAASVNAATRMPSDA